MAADASEWLIFVKFPGNYAWSREDIPLRGKLRKGIARHDYLADQVRG